MPTASTSPSCTPTSPSPATGRATAIRALARPAPPPLSDPSALLDWAEQADPGLPMIHAYRGAILVGLGRQQEADESFDRALYLDPENELALAYRNNE